MTRYTSTIAFAIASTLLLITPVWADRLNNVAQMHGGQAQPEVRSPPKRQPKSVMHRAESDEQLRHKLRDQANKGLVGIVSEGTDETIDIAFALASEHDGIRLLPISGAGASQNVTDIIFTRGIDFGIIQTDVLDEIKRNPPFPGVGKYLEYVTKLYDEQLHVLVGPDIQSLNDLQGKKVNFGRRNSGTYITATNIFKAVGVQPNVTTLPHPLALDQLRRGDISAMVYVGTKSSRMFQDIRPDEKLHFLAVTGNLPKEYTAALITDTDYPELVSQIAPVKTVEVGTVLVAYNWPDKSERYARVNRFVQAFFAHLDEIKAIHPKWHPFDVTSEVSGWTRFPGAERWLKKAGLTPKPDQAAAQLDPNQREELFRAFAAYEKQRQMIVAFHDIAAQ
jgi:TRAP transporter TAXI family solute receptor